MQKRILTGLRTTSELPHIGNYFAAISPLIDLQKEGDDEIIAFLADMHALTNTYDPATIQQSTISTVKTYLACGLDPQKTLIYRQSDIAEHSQLNWVFACITTLGYMKRMHTYKAALEEGTGDEISLGTFNYPVLMAADILLYDADLVPVGKDQKQHLEFARDIGEKFNSMFGETFKLPEPLISQEVATVPGLDGRKMSKSYNNHIGLFEDDKTLLKKIRRISTDAKGVDEPKDPDDCNLYSMLSLFLNEDERKKVREKYEEGGFSYKEGKDMLYEKMLEFSKPIKEKHYSISDQEVEEILVNGTEKAREIASSKIKDVYQKVGF